MVQSWVPGWAREGVSRAGPRAQTGSLSGPCRSSSSQPVAPSWSARLGQAADLAVAHALVDERQELAGGGHMGLGHAPPLGDPVEVGPQLGAARPLAVASIAAHPSSGEPCLVTEPRSSVPLPRPR